MKDLLLRRTLRKTLCANAPDVYAFAWAAIAISLAKMGVLQEILL